MEDKIRIKSLDFWYGSTHALRDLNLEIQEKGITALIGPSGCGKSTFIRTLNRMNDLIPDTRATGEIRLDGVDILAPTFDTVSLRRKVGMVFQKPNPFPKSIYENVIYGPKRHGIRDKEELDDLVEKSLRKAALWTETKDKLHKPALELSGGQQQRLCIARCLAIQPEVLLMDEPTSALDPISTMKIEDLFTQLKEEYTVVIVTHSMQQAARISDQTAFFLNGEIIESGPTQALFSAPKDQRTEDYITGRFS